MPGGALRKARADETRGDAAAPQSTPHFSLSRGATGDVNGPSNHRPAGCFAIALLVYAQSPSHDRAARAVRLAPTFRAGFFERSFSAEPPAQHPRPGSDRLETCQRLERSLRLASVANADGADQRGSGRSVSQDVDVTIIPR